MRTDIAERLLAVQPGQLGPERHGLVDPTGTIRRLQALSATGWPQMWLADRLGMTRTNYARAFDGSPIRAATRANVVQLYDQLWNAEPPSTSPHDRRAITIAKRTAARRGWVPPQAWDDDEIDDPTAQPDVGTNCGSAAALAQDVEELLDAGEIPEMISTRLGRSLAAILLALRRGAEPDTADRLAATSKALASERAATSKKRAA